jgi:hypothetical protein
MTEGDWGIYRKVRDYGALGAHWAEVAVFPACVEQVRVSLGNGFYRVATTDHETIEDEFSIGKSEAPKTVQVNQPFVLPVKVRG